MFDKASKIDEIRSALAERLPHPDFSQLHLPHPDLTHIHLPQAPDVRDSLEKLHACKETLGEAAANFNHIASHLLGALGGNAHRELGRARNRWERVRNALPEPQTIGIARKGDDALTKWLFLGAGLLGGVALGMLLAPTTGRRSRALLRDKVARAGHEIGDLGSGAIGRLEGLKHRVDGLAAEAKGMVQPGDAGDDNTVADRVRTALGEHFATRRLPRVNVECVDGVVTLRGPMIDAALEPVIEGLVRRIHGVREVNLLFLVDAPEEEAFVG